MQAILITAYKNFAQLTDIIQFFNAGFELYIHIDKKHKPDDSIINELQKYPQVKLISFKYTVNYAGLNHLKSILYLSEQALLNPNVQYIHSISGQDFPTKSLQYFQSFVKQNKTTNYLQYFKMPNKQWENGGMDRIELYNFYDVFDAKKRQYRINKLLEFQKKLGIKRSLSSQIKQLYGGSTWWSLSRQTLHYVIDYTNKQPYLIKRLKHSFCSEEIYFQTVIMNSEFASNVINNNLRYVNWELKHGSIPAIIDIADLENIRKGNYLFARKFDAPFSDELKGLLHK